MSSPRIPSLPKGGRTLLLLLALAVAFGAGFAIRGGGGGTPSGAGHDHAEPAEATVWTCSMHPQIKLPKPGQCPICFMDLIPLESSDGDELGPRTLVLSESASALADIRTSTAERKAVSAELRLIGKVDYDETRVRTISAWVPGRIDTLFVDFTGTSVARGERLASLYSPELYAAQSELLNALEARGTLSDAADPRLRESAEQTVAAARERLKLWGLDPAQIDRIIADGRVSDHVDIKSPLGGVVVHKDASEGMYVQTGTRIYTVADLSRVWVILEAYESDIVWLQEGQTIEFMTEALPGRRLSGEIVFIDPVLDPGTRTVEVRVEAENADGLLKPGMFVDARVHAGTGESDEPLVIPASAPLVTGERAIVYVRLPGHEKPTFEGREIRLGPRVGDEYIVASGLEEGEIVVTRGNFKIDSALQIQAKPSMMNPVGDGSEPDTGHDGHEADSGDSPVAPVTLFPDVAEAFRDQLRDLLSAYLDVQTALAADDDGTAREAARRAGDALEAVDMALVDGDAHMAWMKDLARLRESFDALASAGGIEARRGALLPATEALWPALNRFGISTDGTVRLFHCPMANDNQGADWIQLSPTTANPYYGASMLRCGSQTDSLTVAGADEGR